MFVKMVLNLIIHPEHILIKPLCYLTELNQTYLASDKTPTTEPSAATNQDTILPLYNGKIALSSIISSLTTPKSSSLDLKKNLNF